MTGEVLCPLGATTTNDKAATKGTVASATAARLATPFMLVFSPLFFLAAGIMLVCAGIVFVAESISLASSSVLVFGAILLIGAFSSRRAISEVELDEATTGLALFVTAEFLAGAFLAFIGVSNLILDRSSMDYGLVALEVFGLVMVCDSLFFYRSAFKRSGRYEKGL